jgi:hypothetical protein
VEWTLFNYVPDGPGVPGFDGRTRYTFRHDGSPDNILDIYREPASFGSANSNNPATDLEVQIPSESTGLYPAIVDEDMALIRLTLLWDYVEAAGMYEWARRVVDFGASSAAGGKTDMLLIDPGSGIADVTYRGCFPIRWEQRGGFTQDLKLQDYVVFECDTRDDGSTGGGP